MSRPRVSVPSSAAPGETISIRALISHPMENGMRRDGSGALVPRRIINRFECTFNGQDVFAVDLDSAISANPYFEFPAKVPESGTFQFTWHDDDGSTYTEQAEITIG
jgi:sulfur-oxidizing protein SoxZ